VLTIREHYSRRIVLKSRAVLTKHDWRSEVLLCFPFMEPTPIVASARQRAREAVTADILAEARRQLAVEGAASLSLRSVARSLGMASSAIYRYIPSRDELLTALIVEGYNSLGEVAEAAAAQKRGTGKQFRSVCRIVREWAVAHPHEYGLLYGTPVPGYRAPELTVGPASRVILVITGLVVDAYAADELLVHDDPPVSRAMTIAARRIGAAVMPDVPLTVVARTTTVWALLFGQISFEVFGRWGDVLFDTDAAFEQAVSDMAYLLGLPADGERRSSSTK
jgi:AcrR family transcriptional regulator